MATFNMKRFEAEYGELAMDCAEAREDAIAAEKKVTALRRERGNPEAISFWQQEERRARERWMLLRGKVASHKLILKQLRAAAKAGDVELTY